MRYHKTQVIAGKGLADDQFTDALRGLAIDGENRLYAVGDCELKVFSPEGKLLAGWPTSHPGHSVGIAPDGHIFVGEPGQLEVFDDKGHLRETWRDADRMGLITEIGFSGDAVLLADTADRCIRRYDRDGQHVSDIGNDNRMKGFVLPNKHVDFAVDSTGVILAPNPGRHRIERYSLDGKLLGHVGRFDGRDPAGFTGCCNPTNVAVLPGGLVVVTVKAEPYGKIYDADGKLRGVLGQGDFDASCKNMDVAVDSQGRIYIIDTVRLCVCVYEREGEQTTQPTASEGETAKP